MTNPRPRRHDGTVAVLATLALVVLTCLLAACGSGSKTVTCSEHDHPKTACKQVPATNGGYIWIALHPVSRSNPYRGTEPDEGFWHDLTHDGGGTGHGTVDDPVHVGGDE